MLNCKTGYVLRTGSGSECPQCTCQAVAVQPLRCTSALFCHRGCVLGYKHGDHGCPSCSCISPSEIGVTSHTAIFITSSVRCNAHFSCSKHCDFGYRSGDNSCPTCQCLIPIKAWVYRCGMPPNDRYFRYSRTRDINAPIRFSGCPYENSSSPSTPGPDHPCQWVTRRGRFIQHYLHVDEVLYKRSSLRQQLSRRLLLDGFRGRQMSSLHLHKNIATNGIQSTAYIVGHGYASSTSQSPGYT